MASARSTGSNATDHINEFVYVCRPECIKSIMLAFGVMVGLCSRVLLAQQLVDGRLEVVDLLSAENLRHDLLDELLRSKFAETSNTYVHSALPAGAPLPKPPYHPQGGRMYT